MSVIYLTICKQIMHTQQGQWPYGQVSRQRLYNCPNCANNQILCSSIHSNYYPNLSL